MSRTTTTAAAGRLTQRAVPPSVLSLLGGRHRVFDTESGCSVIVAREPARDPKGLALPESALLLWHMSIAHPDRYPTWDEIADVRYRLVPDDVTMAMLLPPTSQYVNAHEHCFHLWEIDDPRGPNHGT